MKFSIISVYVAAFMAVVIIPTGVFVQSLPDLSYGGSSFCSSSNPCAACHGDCDDDDDCANDLLCWNRDNLELEVPETCNQDSPLIPIGTTRDSVDYCYECPVGRVCLMNSGDDCNEGKNGNVAQGTTHINFCVLCQGDCDDDDQCLGGPATYCVQKSSSGNDDNQVQGCYGSDDGSTDYCGTRCPDGPLVLCDLTTATPVISGQTRCTSSNQCQQCQGGCTADADCEGDLVCKLGGPPPECTGTAATGVQYCGLAGTPSPTVSPTKAPTAPPTVSPTKNPTTPPTVSPTKNPTTPPTAAPTAAPTTPIPTLQPTVPPTAPPSIPPTQNPTAPPTVPPTPNPTTPPTIPPTAPPTPTGILIQDIGSCGTGECGQCQGDCDDDNDCAAGLVCFQRRSTDAGGSPPDVPGCLNANTDFSSTDYCSDCGAPSTDICNRGPSFCTSSSPCGVCDGDCDDDDDCEGNLLCFQRENGEPVPGCNSPGNEPGNNDYCYVCESNPRLCNFGSSFCSPTSQCTECQGDCDSDADCVGTLKCFHRSSGDTVQIPGCTEGSFDGGTDYCYDDTIIVRALRGS